MLRYASLTCVGRLGMEEVDKVLNLLQTARGSRPLFSAISGRMTVSVQITFVPIQRSVHSGYGTQTARLQHEVWTRYQEPVNNVMVVKMVWFNDIVGSLGGSTSSQPLFVAICRITLWGKKCTTKSAPHASRIAHEIVTRFDLALWHFRSYTWSIDRRLRATWSSLQRSFSTDFRPRNPRASSKHGWDGRPCLY